VSRHRKTAKLIETPALKWARGIFSLRTATGERKRRVGWFWRNWGVAGGSGVWSVSHLPTGRYVTSFSGGGRTARSVGKRFCEEANRLAAWTAPLVDDPNIGLRLHRIALRLSGGRPALRLLQGGAEGASS
jgi:hypothetical protein